MRVVLATMILSAFCAGAAESTDVTLAIPAAGERLVERIDPKGAERTTVSFAVPISDIQQLWTPDLKQPFLDRKWWVFKDSAPQHDMPYLALFNLAEQNRFSFGSESLEWDNQIESKIDQQSGVYRIKQTVVAGPKGALKPFKVTLDRRPLAWTRVLADWRDSLGYAKGNYPEAAWRPVYCSWYAVHAAVTQDWTERTAAIAADLGFGTFILDDGWSYDEAKRVNPTTIKTWYRDVGEWTAFSKVKFPDFKAHRERMRKTGMKYIVWTAPYFLGTRSPAYRKWGCDQWSDQPFEGNVLTDVTDGKVMESVTEQLVTLLKTADLDGLKIDFLDYIKPSIEKPRGAASLAYVEELMKRLREVKPDGIFEFRQSYANPIMAHLGTQFRAGDVPFEWLSNLMRIAQIRLAMGDKVPIHADPIFWSDAETDDNVARHFLAAMAGVPMLSIDLERLTQERRETVRRYLRLYETRIARFHREGHWDVLFRNGGLAGVTSVLPDEGLVIVNDVASAPDLFAGLGPRKLTVLNLGFRPVTLPDGRTVAPAAYE